MNERQFGPSLTKDGASFRLWAPAAKPIDVVLENPMDDARRQGLVLRRDYHDQVRNRAFRDRLEGNARTAAIEAALAVLLLARLAGSAFGEAKSTSDGLLTVHWRMGDGATLSLLANLSDHNIPLPPPNPREPTSGARVSG